MRYGVWIAMLMALVTAAGCSGRGHQSPGTALLPEIAPAPAAIAASGNQVLLPVGTLRVSADPLQATLEPADLTRTATAAQADLFDLDLESFREWQQFAISGARLRRLGDVEIGFTHSHPFGAPDFSQPASNDNRADLGYTGRVLILTDVPEARVDEQTFFDDIVTNTWTIEEADGYLNPGDLLSATGLTANTFPYMLLADDDKNNRIGITNDDNPAGNYDPAVGGWQRSNAGEAGTGWTGYDYLHAGQSVMNTIRVRREVLEQGPFEVPIALLIQYAEPKQQSSDRSLRLPPEPADVAAFAYRLPHAALDVSEVRFHKFPEEGPHAYPSEFPYSIFQLESPAGSTGELRVALRDWDQGAVESIAPGIAADPDVSLIEPGTSGTAVVEASVPGVQDTPAVIAPDGTLTSGHPGDWQPYLGMLTNDAGAAAGQDWPGLLRVTDNEAQLETVTGRYGLDPGTLAASPERALAPVTYQAFTVRIVEPFPAFDWHVIDPSGAVADYSSIAVIPTGPGAADDRIGIAYFDQGTEHLKFAMAQRLDPRSAADWNVHVADVDQKTGYGPHLIVYQGKPAVSYRDFFERSLKVAFATVPSPGSPFDWNRTTVDDKAGRLFVHASLAEAPDGSLQIAYRGNPPFTTRYEVNFGQALVPNPSVPADWQIHMVGRASGDSTGARIPLVHEDGLPVLMYSGFSEGSEPIPTEFVPFIMAEGLNSSPSSSDEWQLRTHTLGATGSTPFNVDGRWIIAPSNGGTMGATVALVDEPVKDSDWYSYIYQAPFAPSSIGSGFNSILWNEQVIAIYRASEIGFVAELSRSVVSLPVRSADWQVVNILDLGSNTDAVRSLTMVQDHLVFSFQHSNQLAIAYATTPLN